VCTCTCALRRRSQLHRSRLCNCSMAGIWSRCNVEQKFVSGYFDTLPSTCPNNTGRYRCQQRLSDPSGNKLGCDNGTNATVSPASYAGDVQETRPRSGRNCFVRHQARERYLLIRNVVKTVGLGTVENALNQPEFKMTVNQAGDSVSFRSAERGRYAEGYTQWYQLAEISDRS
jgi:hypothetical protein